MPTRLNDIETTFHLRVSEALQGLDQIISKTKQAEKSLGNTQQAFTQLGRSLALFGAASTAAFGLAIRGALEEEQQLGQLRATVEGIGDSFEAQRPGIESFIDGLTKATRFSDDQLRPALNRAILATNSVDEGMRAAELGAKVAAAGFGNLEQNATLIARLFEGQVGAIGRLIPEFRDLEERLEAGATEAGLAAEALDRLNKIAAEAPPPDSLNLLTKAVGELQDAAGKAAFEGLEPLIGQLTKAVESAELLAQTDFGKFVIPLTAFAGVLTTVAGGAILFIGNVIKSADAIGTLADKAIKGSKALQAISLALAGPGGLIALAIIAGIAIAGFSIILDEMSKKADEARDKLFESDRATQFRSEIDKLTETIKRFEAGQISANDAQKEFNKFGVQNLEQAKQRIEVLGRVVERLDAEKDALEGATKADKAHGDQQSARIAKIIAEMEKEKQANFELDTAKQLLFERDRKRGEELLRQAGLLSERPATPAEPVLPQIPGRDPGAEEGALDFITGDVQIAAEAMGTLEERVNAIVATEAGFGTLEERLAKVAAATQFAAEQAAAFGLELQKAVAGALEGMAALLVNVGEDLITNFDDAGKNATKFFKQLIAQLIRAIAFATILNAIISALPGGGFLGGVRDLLSGGGPFQDPLADQMARFEGSRFADLFFQGMFREFNTSQERMESALTQNRDINRSNSRSMTAIVNEATPETTVEFTDRHVEPRVRQRANQRSSRGTLTDAERDRQIENINERLDALGAT